MRISLIAACAAALAFSGVVAADEPIQLTSAQMDEVTAGVGSGDFPGAGAAGWFGGPTGTHGLNGNKNFSAPPGPTENVAGVWVPRTPGNPG